MNPKRRAVVMLASSVITLGLLAGPAEAKRAPYNRPDLVVPSAGLNSADHDFHLNLHEGVVKFTETTRNIGRKTAGPTKTRLLYARKPTSVRGRPGPAVVVPKLAPGKEKTAVKREVGGAAGLPFGSYYVIVCANDDNTVDEHSIDNNCTYTGDRFDVLVGRWTGTVSGSHQIGVGPGVTESWTSSPDLVFTFDSKEPSMGGGWYRYAVEGNEHYTISGTDAYGCTYSGNKDYDVTGRGALYVDYRRQTYGGVGDGEPAYTYETVCPCPDLGGTCTATQSSPQNLVWWSTNSPSRECPNPQTFAFSAGEMPQLLDHCDDNSQPYDPLHWEWDITAAE
jgi:hypothetical protein